MVRPHTIRIMGSVVLGASLAFLWGCGSDGGEAARAANPPPVLDVDALVEYVRPTDAHPAVLVNLWATW